MRKYMNASVQLTTQIKSWWVSWLLENGLRGSSRNGVGISQQLLPSSWLTRTRICPEDHRNVKYYTWYMQTLILKSK